MRALLFLSLLALVWLFSAGCGLGGEASPLFGDELAGDDDALDEVESEDVDVEWATTTILPEPGVVVERSCSPGGSCASEFILDGAVYSLSCAAVRDDSVTAEILGSGLAFGQGVEVRSIVDFEGTGIVAIDVPGGYCSETDPDEIHTSWSLAFSNRARASMVEVAACQIGALSPLQIEANECDRFLGSSSTPEDQGNDVEQRQPVALDAGDLIGETVLTDGVFVLVEGDGTRQPSMFSDLGGWLVHDETDQPGLSVLVAGESDGQGEVPSAVFLATSQDGLSLEGVWGRVWLVHDALVLPAISDSQMLLSESECSTLRGDDALVVLAEISPLQTVPFQTWRVDPVTLSFMMFDSDSVECEYETT